MVTSIHTLIYSDDANATRAFLRDVLGWKYATEDWDHDWLIFKSGPSELAVHPSRDARAPDQKCLLEAHCREAMRLLLRPFRVLQQKLGRS